MNRLLPPPVRIADRCKAMPPMGVTEFVSKIRVVLSFRSFFFR